ncbi:MAG: hypothetical protein JAY66_28105 [Candidatus Thiodiazotropha taylori]|nr:hypothetical protein [Candidatus Thiodiazotropha taylori]
MENCNAGTKENNPNRFPRSEVIVTMDFKNRSKVTISNQFNPLNPPLRYIMGKLARI